MTDLRARRGGPGVFENSPGRVLYPPSELGSLRQDSAAFVVLAPPSGVSADLAAVADDAPILPLSRAAEKKDIAVRVGDFEAAQSIARGTGFCSPLLCETRRICFYSVA